jgi:hypothetical protein
MDAVGCQLTKADDNCFTAAAATNTIIMFPPVALVLQQF